MNRVHLPGAAAVCAALACALLALALAGCGAHQRTLDGAVYANCVPIYKNIEPRNQMGGHYEDGEGNTVSQTQTWFFDASDSKEAIVEYYKKNFPDAQVSRSEDGDDVVFNFVPKGAEDGESVYVAVGDGGFRIGEECKPGKIKS